MLRPCRSRTYQPLEAYAHSTSYSVQSLALVLATLTCHTAYHRSRSSRTATRIVVHRAVDFLVSRDLFNTDCGRCLIVTSSDSTRSDYNDCASSTEPGHQVLLRLCHNHASSPRWVAVKSVSSHIINVDDKLVRPSNQRLQVATASIFPDHRSVRLL